MWPTDVIKYYRSTTTGSTADVRTSGDLHNNIGRRPTLKFGLAEGVPDYMAPDHQVGSSLDCSLVALCVEDTLAQHTACSKGSQSL